MLLLGGHKTCAVCPARVWGQVSIKFVSFKKVLFSILHVLFMLLAIEADHSMEGYIFIFIDMVHKKHVYWIF